MKNMFKSKSMLFAAAAMFAVIVCGCADPVVFAEVFQLEKGQDICTAYLEKKNAEHRFDTLRFYIW